jgi:hypothetical protein
MRLSFLLVAFVVVVGAWSTAQARIHSLSGNARFQVGNLPIPITFTGAPNGKVLAVAGATIRVHGMHAATSPARVVIDPTQLSHPGTPPVNLLTNLLFVPATFPASIQPFQLNTAISLRFPKSKISFRAFGRTGPPLVTFCGKPPSTTIVKAGANPACVGGPSGTGLLRYTQTSNQFGGPARGAVGGVANQALGLGATAPCTGPPTCHIVFFDATPGTLEAVGGSFGLSIMSTPTAPSPGGFFGTVGPLGTVLNLGTDLEPGLTNAGTGWGGPWTTGMLTASNPSVVPPQKFTLTGADGRAAGSGTGSLSLVAGGFSQRSISGPKANTGWLNLSVGPKVSHIPVLPIYGVAALVGLTALSGAYALRRRRNQ